MDKSVRNEFLTQPVSLCFCGPAFDGPMIKHAASTDDRRASLPLARLVIAAAALMAVLACGCSQLRLPAIDPTGRCLFAPKPTTTTLALPGSGGEGCLCRDCFNRIKDGVCGCFKKPFQAPEPAFPEPVPPPPCPTPATTPVPMPTNVVPDGQPCVPGPACNGSCATGPRAVLIGSEIDGGHCGKLPKRGKRGCILLSPTRIVAPVGGEVVLLSGICGTDGYLQMNEKLEWMLTPDSVGTFIQVGDDYPNLIHRLAGPEERPRKVDPSYALGVTSTKPTLITRGNNNPRDDVRLEKGQTWLTVSSPSEGTSHVTVLAPESECWDQRKATATIYWVDARALFPAPQIVPAGTPVELTTRVTRSEGTLPAEGWKVRYEILQPNLATFAGTGGSAYVEALVDASGNATVQLQPQPGTSGTAMIQMQVIRPGGKTDNMPTLPLANGQTTVTWSAPQLALNATAPSVATFGEPVQVVANVSNPGDQAATNVRVDVQVPAGTEIVSADSFAQVLPNSVAWEIGSIPPRTQLDLFMTVAPQATVDLVFQARGDGLVAEDSVRIDVFRPSLQVRVQPLQDRVEAGQPVGFNIDVINIGDRPLRNIALQAIGNRDMIHESGQSTVNNAKENGPLQPGETWGAEVTFIPTAAGRRCVQFVATADGGQQASAEGCVTAINPIPRTPNLEVTLQSRQRIAVGETALIEARIRNRGQGPAENVQVSIAFDPQLRVLQATEGADQSRIDQNIVSWTLPRLEAGQDTILEAQVQASGARPQAQVRLRAESQQGISDDTDLLIEVFDATTPAPGPQPPALPPAGPAPEVPTGPAPEPLSGEPPMRAPELPPTPTRSNQLQVNLFGRDNPVQVNQPIRYSLQVVNDTNQIDGQVEVQFELPDGVQLERVSPMTNPELAGYEVNSGIVTLAYIRRLNPGESVEYELVLSSNQPQTFQLPVRVRSQQFPQGVQATASTTVTP